MAIAYNPKIVTRNLLLNLDFGNIRKCYNGSENLFTYSEQFNNAIWGKVSSTVSIDTAVTTAPDGTTTAEKLIGNNGATTRQSIYQDVVLTAGTTYTFSVFLKQAERRYGTIWFDSTSIAEGLYYGAGTYFDLQTGTIAAGSETRIVSYPNGWHRLYLTATPTVTTTFRLQIAIGTPNNASDGAGSAAYQYTGNGSAGFYVWGAQLEKGRATSPYVQTVASTVTRPTVSTSIVSEYTHDINKPQYTSYDEATNSIRFDRNETFANFTGSITSNVLTVTAVSGITTIVNGAALSYAGLTPTRVITSFGTGTGGTGTYNVSAGIDTTSRGMTAAFKNGGSISVLTSGALASNTYLYNNHTTEVWARINDRFPSFYDGYEGESALVVFAGYHSMFLYGSNYLRYSIWDNTGPTFKATSDLSLGTSGTDIIQGQWFHVVVTKTGTTFRTYLNGTLRKTDTITSTALAGVTNRLSIGSAFDNNVNSFNYYGKNNVGCLKMYNTPLSADEIAQNFNALRGRYGI